MADHKHAVQNAEGVRGTDMNGNVVVLAKTHPEQLVLFQTFLSDEDDNGHGDEKYSNTIELYDAVPKYFSNPRLMDRMRKDGKYLPMLERLFKHRGEMYTVKIWPARLEDRLRIPRMSATQSRGRWFLPAFGDITFWNIS